MSFEVSAYRPRFTNGHAQTLYAWGRRRAFPRLPAPADRYFDVAPGTQVLAQCHWQPDRTRHPAILLLHGLEGSSAAHYMCGMADKAWARGWNVIRLNQRNCGNTEHLTAGLYHSGLTQDPLHVLRELIDRDGFPAVAVAGYSLGGNLALKLAGELGADVPPALKAVCAVCPTVDLARCVDALERRANVVYHWNFVRNLKARMRRKAAAMPTLYSSAAVRGIWTVRRFDDVFTAPHHGFRDSADYYYRASALRVVERIRVPALILAAGDDPFVPSAPFAHPAVRGNPHITVRVTPNGGHCGFVERTGPDTDGYDGYWAEREVLRFAEHFAELPSIFISSAR